MKMNVNRTMCGEVDSISVSLCVLQHETLVENSDESVGEKNLDF